MTLSSRSLEPTAYSCLLIFYQNQFRTNSARHTFKKPKENGKEICWFLFRIPYYQKKGCTLPQAIDFAIDDCLTEGIFYFLFLYHREEIKEMLLAGFPASFFS